MFLDNEPLSIRFRCEKCKSSTFRMGETWTNRPKDGPGKITWLELTCAECGAHEVNAVITAEDVTELYAYLVSKTGERGFVVDRAASYVWRAKMGVGIALAWACGRWEV